MKRLCIILCVYDTIRWADHTKLNSMLLQISRLACRARARAVPSVSGVSGAALLHPRALSAYFPLFERSAAAPRVNAARDSSSSPTSYSSASASAPAVYCSSLVGVSFSNVSHRRFLSTTSDADSAALEPAFGSAKTNVVTKTSTIKIVPVRLNTIANNPGATRQKKRVGRGPGSGRGKTAGRGHKGQKSRNNGGIRLGFEGGQTPLYRLLPKRGFKNKFARPMEPVNLSKLQDWIAQGRIDPRETITMKHLFDSGLVTRIRHGVKLLGTGADEFKVPVDIEVTQASKSAIAAIEQCGGSIKTVYHNRLGLRVLLKPEKFDGVLPRRARPPPKLMPYYLNYENRGEFSAEVQLAEAEKKAALRAVKNAKE